MGVIRAFGLVVVLAGLAACTMDPGALGITGPDEQIAPRPADGPTRSGTSDSSGGVVIDPSQPGGGTGGRYWRYH